jgi:hypothetical protein
MIDLRSATLDPSGARLAVRAVFGGGQIFVPESWSVATRVSGIGGLTDVRSDAERAATGPELVIEGTLVFGGFVIMSEAPAGAEHWLAENARPTS